MEQNRENDQIYILNSKKNINNFIHKNEYGKAFGLLILVLERLDNNEKVEFINYYSKKLNDLITGISHFDDRRLDYQKV